MSLQALLKAPSTSASLKEYHEMAMLEPLRHDELDEDARIKMSLPLMYANKKINLPRVVDEFTRKPIDIHMLKGTTTLAFLYKGGIVICADSRASGGMYIGSGTVRKIIPISKYLVGTMAGGASDCVYWERVLAERCRLYELRNREPISVAAASKLLVNMLYNYKGRGLSLGVMISGWDRKKGPKIYQVTSECTRVQGNLFSVGSGSVYAYGVLDKGYKFDLTDEEAFDLGRRAIYHATHRDAASGGTIRVWHINKDGYRVVSEEDMSILHDRYVSENSVSMNH